MGMLGMMAQPAAGLASWSDQPPMLIGNLTIEWIGIIVGISVDGFAAHIDSGQQLAHDRGLAGMEAAHLKTLDNPRRIGDDMDAIAAGKAVGNFAHRRVGIFREAAYHQGLPRRGTRAAPGA